MIYIHNSCPIVYIKVYTTSTFRIIVSFFKTYTFPLFIAIALLGIHSCVTPFEPETTQYENLLVVDGFISDKQEQYIVNLSTAIEGEYQHIEKLSDCIVNIICNDGKIIHLTESSTYEGRYESPPNSLQGEIGKKYKLYIKTNNKEYETDFIQMQSSPPIDSLYYKNIVENNGITDVEGIEFYIDFKKTDNCSDYISWGFDEAWSFATVHSEHFIKTCYKQSCRSIFETNEFASKKNNVSASKCIYKILNSDFYRSMRLEHEYLLFVHQYGIDEEAYFFYQRNLEQIKKQGSMYDKTPIAIQGNIKCKTNPEETVLGFFKVASVQSKKIKVFNKDIMFSTAHEEVCDAIIEFNLFDTIVADSLLNSRGYSIIRDIVWINDSTALSAAIKSRGCIECENYNASPTPPDFWE